MARAIVAVVVGILVSFACILLVQALGALVAPAGVAPALKDTERMREYLGAMPWSAYAFLLAAYLAGSFAGATVAARVVRDPRSGCVWIVGGILLVTTIANLVMIPHPGWFSVAAVAAIFAGTWVATRLPPAAAR